MGKAEGESSVEINVCPIRDTFSISISIKSFKEILGRKLSLIHKESFVIITYSK